MNGANLEDTKLCWINNQRIQGQKVITVQVDLSDVNNQVSYWVDLDIWTTRYFQGSIEKLQQRIDFKFQDNKVLKDRYYRAINFILNEAEQDKLRDEGVQ